MTERTSWAAGSLYRVLAGILGVGDDCVALGAGGLADVGVGVGVGEAAPAETVEAGADDGAEAESEHPAAVSAVAERSRTGIALCLRIQSA
ncbi:hypothetical protein [Kribbella swartbergensis]